MIVALEWSSFVCTHCHGANWKSSFERAPWLVTKVMDNGTSFLQSFHEENFIIIILGFYTPLGILVISGLHVLPVALYIEQDPPYGLDLEKYHVLVYCIIALLTIGRTVCAIVEVSPIVIMLITCYTIFLSSN